MKEMGNNVQTSQDVIEFFALYGQSASISPPVSYQRYICTHEKSTHAHTHTHTHTQETLRTLIPSLFTSSRRPRLGEFSARMTSP